MSREKNPKFGEISVMMIDLGSVAVADVKIWVGGRTGVVSETTITVNSDYFCLVRLPSLISSFHFVNQDSYFSLCCHVCIPLGRKEERSKGRACDSP